MKTVPRVRKLRQKESGKAEPVASEKPVPSAEVAQESSTQSQPAPVVYEIQMQESVSEDKISPSNETATAPLMDFSSPKAEFSLRIGSFDEARKSMITSYFVMVLIPTVLLLLVLSRLDPGNSEADRGLVNSLRFMLGTIAVLGVPMMALSWFHGFYPKGSYGRFASGSALALLLGLWLALVLVASDLQGAAADFGAALKLDRLSAVVCLVSAFVFARAASELMDDRRAWRKKLGIKDKKIMLNLGSKFLDFDYHIGRYKKGIAAAWMAYVHYVVVPTILLVSADYALNGLNLEAKSSIVASVGSMFGIVLLFGGVLVVVRFFRGFYPCGSISRASFGLATVPILVIFSWAILIGSGMESQLAQNKFLIDMSLVMLPVIMHVSFTALFELSEFKDGRRAYRRWIGLPVTTYIPGDKYHKLLDFNFFYASFASGTRRARWVHNKYALEILAVVVVISVGVTIYTYPDTVGLSEDLRSYLNPDVLDYQMDRTILVLLVLASANTVGVFIAFSYREGSFARLVMSGVVAVFASQWAYYFWSSLASVIQPKEVVILDTGVTLNRVVYSIMFLFFGLIVLRAVRHLYGWYLKSRNEYVDWRLKRLRMEAEAGLRASAPATPIPSQLGLTADTPVITTDSSGPPLFPEKAPSRPNPLAASFSFDVSSAVQSIPMSSPEASVMTKSWPSSSEVAPAKTSTGSRLRAMEKYMAITRMPASKIIQKATRHFGPRSGGLMVKLKTDTSICLEGPDGCVKISVCPCKSKARRNEVDIETDQFDKKVKEFLAKL